MRAVIQRVKEASVDVDNKRISHINHGLLIYLGVTHEDTEDNAKKLADKVSKLRIFEDNHGKMNKDISAIDGAILVVSQFTLYGDVKGNNRPSFTMAAAKEHASALYDKFVQLIRTFCHVETGIFQAHMQVSSINDGPVTIIVEY